MTIKVCFIVLDAYPVINPAVRRPFGGIETEAWVTLRTLAAFDDLDISMVVRTTRPITETTCQGVTVIPQIEPWYYVRKEVSDSVDVLPHFPWLRLKQWRTPLLWQVPLLAVMRPFRKPPPAPQSPVEELASLDVDAYCCFGVGNLSARILATARQTGRKYIQRISSDADLEIPEKHSPADRNPYGEHYENMRYTLEHADCITTQKATQHADLKSRFDRDSCFIPNPIDMQEWRVNPAELPPELYSLPERYVLWIGRADEHHKRPKICYEIARACPEITFVMIVNPGSEDVQQYLDRNCPENVTIIKRVPFKQMPFLFSRAVCYLSTSSALYEGFPNVLLQAACSGVPIASLEVCPEFIEAAQAGIYADGDQAQLKIFLQQIWQDEAAAGGYGAAAREYISAHHDHRKVGEQWAELIRNCMS